MNTRLQHGTYVYWLLRNRCALMEKSLLFDRFKAFDQIESSHKSDFFFSQKRTVFLHAGATSIKVSWARAWSRGDQTLGHNGKFLILAIFYHAKIFPKNNFSIVDTNKNRVEIFISPPPPFRDKGKKTVKCNLGSSLRWQKTCVSNAYIYPEFLSIG